VARRVGLRRDVECAALGEIHAAPADAAGQIGGAADAVVEALRPAQVEKLAGEVEPTRAPSGCSDAES